MSVVETAMKEKQCRYIDINTFVESQIEDAIVPCSIAFGPQGFPPELSIPCPNQVGLILLR